ncbi:MAG: bifunctional UDP-N-acetylglucosamine diphosphorylase/glucosamine-1-phosphate N-acetyltransferase GlmU [Actinomycetota bacterium]|nr:bifunctional UDP-N-acetylglucosamine diphosphorylase/glucosamine-1-phosphate N-acetyltransferase GlmU [Actinomycetota bacterium]
MAAGDGKRLKSAIPKVLHEVSGKPLVVHVLAALAGIERAATVLVASPRVDEIRTTVASHVSEDITYVVQERPAGTADAARLALEALPAEIRTVLIVPGDTPLVTGATLASLLAAHRERGTALTLLTASVLDPTGYGRVVRGAGDRVEAVVEDRDADERQRALDEINAGVYVVELERLQAALPKVGAENAQTEYYLTDVVGLMAAEGDEVMAVATDAAETHGVNSRADLARVEAAFRQRTCERWMAEGVTIVDPATTYIDASVDIGDDAVIRPFTFLEGATSIGSGAEIGPHARVVDSSVAARASISYAVVRGSTVGEEASVGPFASLRPGTSLGARAHIGTFVETKAATIGDDSKANHLAYLGDAEIGSGVNVGAGTITCNWDGQDKHQTVIDDDAYIGSDTMLVAPVRVGKRAATGAGSVVRDDVPDDALAIGVPARIVEGKGDKMGKKPGRPDGNEGG